MPSIDQRIVQMSFENAKFEAGVAQSMATLTKLDASLQQIGKTNALGDIEKEANKVTLEQPVKALDKLKGRLFGSGKDAAAGLGEIEKAGNKVTLEQPVRALDKVKASTADVGRNAAEGFNEIEKAAERVTLGGFARAINGVVSQLNVLEIAMGTVLGNAATMAASKGTAFAKSFAFGPLTDGLSEYKTNLNSIQTILANTEGQQVSGLENVNKTLEELNQYSDQTIYNFSEMAKNIGTFTAAGVDMPKATASIKGIANLAALSGSNSQQASTAMYQLSQAIAAGRVGLQDWNSVVNAGMGGAVFQKSLMRTAENMGALKDGAVAIDKATGKATVNGESFRESIMAKPGQKSWLSSEVLVETLKQFTGDMSEADLIAQGFSKSQAQAIMQQATTAKKAATEVKTLSQVFDVARETIGSGWAKTFQLIFGDFEESKKLFTSVSNTLNNWINKVSDARNKMFGDWKAAGGRTQLLEALKQAFQNILAIIKPIKEAFRDIFPATTGGQLASLTRRFLGLMQALEPSKETVEGLRRTFRGLFAVMHIVWSVIKGVVGVIGDLLGVAGKGSGGFLNFTGSIGDFLVAVDSALTKGGLLTSLFKTISSVLQAPLKLLTGIASAVFGLFAGADSDKADALGGSLGKVGDSANKLTPILRQLKSAWDGLVSIFTDVRAWVGPFLSDVGQALSGFGDTLANAFENVDFDKTMSVLQTGFIGGIFLMIKRGIGGGTGMLGDTLGKLGDVFDGLTGNLQAMQQKVKAQIILQIAAAIGILAAGIYVLSTIDPKKLATAMTAVAVGLGELMGAMKLMTGGLGKVAMVQMPIIAASLVVLAGAVVILAGAMKIFATMDWDEIAKGLVGVGGSLAAVGLGVKALGPGTIIQGPAILGLAIALNVLALAVKQFGDMDWKAMGQGLAGVLLSLLAIATPLAVMGPSVALVGPGLIGAAFAMTLLAGAVAAFGAIKPDQLLTGILGIAGALVALALGISLIPPTVALQAAGLVVMSIALAGIASAIGMLGNMDILTLVKGISAIGGAMAVLAVGLMAMTGTIAGSVALLAAATALAILAPTLGFLGTLKWGTIFKGIASMALVLGSLALVGTLASGGLSALGIALLPLAGVFVATAGAVFIFAKALSLLGDSGGKGLAVMVTAVTAFVALLPKLIIDFVKGLVDVVAEIAKIAPKIVDALTKILETLVKFVLDNVDQFALAFGALIAAGVKAIEENAPKVIQAGAQLLLDLLSGIDRNLPQIMTRVGNIVVKFLEGLAREAPRIITSGANFLLAYIKGITSKIPDLVAAGVKAISSFLTAVGKNAAQIVESGVRLVAGFLSGIAQNVEKVYAAGVRVILALLKGVADNVPKIAEQALKVAEAFVKAMARGMVGLTEIAADAMINVLNGIARVIRTKGPELRRAGWNIADAILDGVIDGFEDLGKRAINAVKGVFGKLPGAAKKILGIKSPSKVFEEIGRNIGLGLERGLDDVNDILTRGITSPILAMLQANKGLGSFGTFIGTEFKKGLTGGLWDDGKSEVQRNIEGTFTSLRDKLKDEQSKLRDVIKEDRERLQEELAKAPEDQDQTLITQLSQNLTATRALLKDATSATSQLIKGLRGTRNDLVALGKDYVKVSEALKEAQTALEEATRTRDDALKSYQQQFSGTPNIDSLVSAEMARLKDIKTLTTEEKAKRAKEAAEEAQRRKQIDELALYKQALQDQVVATQKYAETLQKLRELGLDDTTYKKLLEEGVKGQEFANSLLAAGQAGVDEINRLDSEILKVSTKIARDASINLYQAGVDAARGLVKGLRSQQKEIRATMEDIASEMVRAIKKKLRMRSPSQVFMEVGKFSAEGMAYGIRSSTGEVTDAAQNMGDVAVSSLQNSINRMGDIFSAASIDTEPKITPVLDLTNIKKGASEIAELGAVSPFQAVASYSMASSISADQQAAASSKGGDVEKTVVNFEQHNTSPEALSEAEIYRQTKNGLSQVRQALGFSGYPTTV